VLAVVRAIDCARGDVAETPLPKIDGRRETRKDVSRVDNSGYTVELLAIGAFTKAEDGGDEFLAERS
jgi:hypothetical protein